MLLTIPLFQALEYYRGFSVNSERDIAFFAGSASSFKVFAAKSITIAISRKRFDPNQSLRKRISVALYISI